ncbi:hypothetical protein SAMN06298211_10673 [Prevotellaceae bacterium MN60]|nr:hypothetical protein SAMN06298211_10673 [Prevotellaceae bacterium MN60]
MKQIIFTAMLLTCIVNASAQEKTKLDNLFKELKPFTHKGITTTRGNYGKGQTTTISQVYIGFNEYCSSICGEEGEFWGDSIWNQSTTNKTDHQSKERFLNIVRHHLDSIMPMAEECYHFESHNQGIDTIRYSICLHSGKNQTKRCDNKQGNYSYNNVPGTETVSFSYDSDLKFCKRHHKGEGLLKYSRTESVPDHQSTEKSISFDWAQYMQTITPLLNQQGVIQHKFHWLLDSFVENADKEYLYFHVISNGDGSYDLRGETYGTMYFIPRNQKILADSILKSVDFATQTYIYQHPEQLYEYRFNPHFQTITPPQEYQNHELLATRDKRENPYNHHLIVCSDIRGYYFLVCETKGAMGFPREWGVLKSFVNGKKEYIKGVK